MKQFKALSVPLFFSIQKAVEELVERENGNIKEILINLKAIPDNKLEIILNYHA